MYHYNLAFIYNLLYTFFFGWKFFEEFHLLGLGVVITYTGATGCLNVSDKPKMCRLEMKL